jgi:arylformamidase
MSVVADYNDAGYRLSSWCLGSHNGTHLDAPAHFIPGSSSVLSIAPETLIGDAYVVDVRYRGAGDEVSLEDIAKVLPCERLLLCTGWDGRYGTDAYFTNPPGLSQAAAAAIVDSGVKLLGIDTPNIHTLEWVSLHKVLLGAGVFLVEALTGLSPLAGTMVQLIVAPLPLADSDGAPVRVFARVAE